VGVFALFCGFSIFFLVLPLSPLFSGTYGVPRGTPVLTLCVGCGIIVLRLGGGWWFPVVGFLSRLSLLSEVVVMRYRSLAFARLCAARCGGPAPVVPGSFFPAFVAGGVPPLGAVVRWGVCFGGHGASWRPGLVLSSLDVDVLSYSEEQAIADAVDMDSDGVDFGPLAPLVFSFWVLPSGAVFVASRRAVRSDCFSGAAC
jgi:hypothetical protein